MQNLDPKDRPKLIGISVVLVVVVGIGIKATMDTVNSIAPPATAATPSPAPSVSGVTTPAANGKPTVAAGDTATDSSDSSAYSLDRFPFVAAGGRDPFAPVPDDVLAKDGIHVGGVTPAQPGPTSTPPPTGPSIALVPPIRKGLDGGIGDDLKGVGAQVAPPPPIVRVLAPAAPPYTVIGVVISEPAGRDVAILQRTGGNDKKFVVVGDPLEGGFTVTGIESGGVRIKHPGHKPVTAPIPGLAPTQMPGSTEIFLPRQTIVVPATAMTMPLGVPSTPATPGAPAAVGVPNTPSVSNAPSIPGLPITQNSVPRAK